MNIAVDLDVKPPNKQIIFVFPHQTGNILTMATRGITWNAEDAYYSPDNWSDI